ncbi:hypothetical protein Caferm_05925 [Corynebacterium afermentans subsp. afermentans]|nr:hypothetical protein [Corynebacterium afermentans]OAA16783.1 hypothetical protein Caferm_05925 [Corynebacterium afermentans subsp. afermentans]
MKSFCDIIRTASVAVAASVVLFIGMLIQERIADPHDLVFGTFDYGNNAPLIGEISKMSASLSDVVNGTKTNGKWLVIDFSRKADGSIPLSGVIEDENGTVFYSINPMTYTCGIGYPGLAEDCTLVFEIPADMGTESIREADLVLARTNTKMSPLVVLPLSEMEFVEETSLERENVIL